MKAAATTEVSASADSGRIFLRATVSRGAICQFAYSTDGTTYTPLGTAFTARVSRWVGAKVGVFSSGGNSAFADFECDAFRAGVVETA